MSDDELRKLPTYTYTIKPGVSGWNLVLNVTPKRDIDAEIEKKLTTMPEYKEAQNVLNKFTLHGKD